MSFPIDAAPVVTPQEIKMRSLLLHRMPRQRFFFFLLHRKTEYQYALSFRYDCTEWPVYIVSQNKLTLAMEDDYPKTTALMIFLILLTRKITFKYITHPAAFECRLQIFEPAEQTGELKSV